MSIESLFGFDTLLYVCCESNEYECVSAVAIICFYFQHLNKATQVPIELIKSLIYQRRM